MSSSVQITPERVATRISELRANIDAKRSELDQLIDELEWWESGRRFFGFDGGEEDEEEPDELQPPDAGQQQSFISNGSKPTLREGILRVMAERPKKTWRTEEVLTALRKHGWISDAKHADQHARSKMGALHRKGDLRRVRRGHYRLPPPRQ